MNCQDAILHCSVQFAFLSSLAFFLFFGGPRGVKETPNLTWPTMADISFLTFCLKQKFFCFEHVCDRFGRCAVEPLRLLRPFSFCCKFGQRFFNAASEPYNTLDLKSGGFSVWPLVVSVSVCHVSKDGLHGVEHVQTRSSQAVAARSCRKILS